jgi:hypothetical protein
MAQRTQSITNHARYVPLYHFVLGAILGANLWLTGKALLRGMTTESLMAFSLAVGFLILFWYARAFALAVQDRLIRLEMRLRLEKLLPAEQFARFDQIAPGQLVALRFASDAELPGLVAEVLEGKLSRPADIKRRIQNWQADWMRA